MSITAVNRHPDAGAFAQADAAEVRARDPGVARVVALSSLDKLALDALADPRDLPAIVRWTEDSATALSGVDRNEARVRLISRLVASERSRLLILEALLDERLAARDAAAGTDVERIDRLLHSTTRRLAVLLDQHRSACNAGHRTTVVVGHANAVHVEGNER
jgi:hypothetical protein